MSVEIPAAVRLAVEVARAKQAADIRVLDLREVTTFTDHFVLLSAASVRQVQAIVDGIVDRLKEAGERPSHIEGYDLGEWALIDYTDFVIHVFSSDKREVYDLERLWSDAVVIDVPETAAQER